MIASLISILGDKHTGKSSLSDILLRELNASKKIKFTTSHETQLYCK
jgi:archaellum biogenesis ATPase FlaH